MTYHPITSCCASSLVGPPRTFPRTPPQLAQRCAGHGTAVLRVKGEVHAKGKATVHTTMHKKTIDCHVNRTAAPTPAPSALVS